MEQKNEYQFVSQVTDFMLMHLIAHDVSVSKVEESESTETIIDRDDHNA